VTASNASGAGEVYVYKIAAGGLTQLAGSPYPTGGTDPEGLIFTPRGNYLYVANNGSNSVAGYTIPSNGTCVPTAMAGSPFPAGTAPFGVLVTRGTCAYVSTTVAGAATVMAYVITPGTGVLSQVGSYPAGTGPPEGIASNGPPNSGLYVYMANNGSGNLSAYAVSYASSSLCALTQLAGSPFGAGTGPIGVAAAVYPKPYLYVANNGSSNVSGYRINFHNGALGPAPGSPFGAGTAPFGVAVRHQGKCVYVANNSSGNVSGYTINEANGKLTQVAGSPYAAGTGPEGVIVDTTGDYVYVANNGSNNISGYSIAGNCTLTPLGGSPFSTGSGPVGLVV
jgi:DNA-binding beta-propeller fold protein YncE